MEVQKNILFKIRDETEKHLKGELLPLISDLVITKMKEESDKFFDKTNILGDIFPKPIGSGLFRTCGKCCVCKKNSQGLPGSGFSKAANGAGFSTDELKKDEYIILCSGYGMMNRYPAEMYHVKGVQMWKAKDEIRGEYITNYGS